MNAFHQPNNSFSLIENTDRHNQSVYSNHKAFYTRLWEKDLNIPFYSSPTCSEEMQCMLLATKAACKILAVKLVNGTQASINYPCGAGSKKPSRKVLAMILLNSRWVNSGTMLKAKSGSRGATCTRESCVSEFKSELHQDLSTMTIKDHALYFKCCIAKDIDSGRLRNEHCVGSFHRETLHSDHAMNLWLLYFTCEEEQLRTSLAKEGGMDEKVRFPAFPPVRKFASSMTFSTAFSSLSVRVGAMLAIVGRFPGKKNGKGRLRSPSWLMRANNCKTLISDPNICPSFWKETTVKTIQEGTF